MAFHHQILLSILVVHAANALQCTICLDRVSCNAQPAQQECNADIVNQHHLFLSQINPSLVTAAPSTTFKCYDLDSYYTSALTGSTVLVVQKGCTYSTTEFCVGWTNTTTIEHCGTCSNADGCNSNQNGTTTTTSAPSTNVTTTTVSVTTPVDNSTTTVSSNATTSTTSVPVSSTTVSVSTPTASPNATTSTTSGSGNSTQIPGNSTSTTAAPTPKPGSAGCAVVSWMLVGGFALLHGLVARF